jgi:hypothetical protein
MVPTLAWCIQVSYRAVVVQRIGSSIGSLTKRDKVPQSEKTNEIDRDATTTLLIGNGPDARVKPFTSEVNTNSSCVKGIDYGTGWRESTCWKSLS